MSNSMTSPAAAVPTKNFFGYSTEEKRVSAVMDGNVRLLQQTPAWDLHLLLRANGIRYTTENVLFGIACGQRLPVLVQGNVLCSESSALLSCSEGYSPSILMNGVNEDDQMLATYVNSLKQVASWLRSVAESSGTKRVNAVSALGSRALDWLYGNTQPDGFAPAMYTGCSEEGALQRLSSIYAFLELKLKENGNAMTLDGSERPKLADAILFFHVMEASKDPRVVDVLDRFPGIRKATDALFRRYFTSPHALKTWKAANLQLSRNGIVKGDDALRRCLVEGLVGHLINNAIDDSSDAMLSSSIAPAKPPFLVDFSFQNFFPWRATDCELVDGEEPVLFNLRHMLFATVVVASFVSYGIRSLEAA